MGRNEPEPVFSIYSYQLLVQIDFPLVQILQFIRVDMMHTCIQTCSPMLLRKRRRKRTASMTKSTLFYPSRNAH